MDGDTGKTHDELVSLLSRLIQAIEASGRATLPHSNQELLQSIVEAAARIFGAAASSIALIDPEHQELVFRVAYGAGAGDIIGLRIPLDKGIAGYVAMTGQPLAVSNVLEDSRFNRDFAQSTGYVPRAILAMPLLSGEQVIGVMEILDKLNATSFNLQDMELLALFARQASLAIYQSQQYDQIGVAVQNGLKRLLQEATDQESEATSRRLNELQANAPADLLALADLFHDLAMLGEAERRLCLETLEVYRRYRKTRLSRRY